jgi:hypothetical protein
VVPFGAGGAGARGKDVPQILLSYLARAKIKCFLRFSLNSHILTKILEHRQIVIHGSNRVAGGGRKKDVQQILLSYLARFRSSPLWLHHKIDKKNSELLLYYVG